MNGTDVELRKELWMWRGVAILFLLILLITNTTEFIVDRSQHADDNRDRAAAWTSIQKNQDAIKGMLLKNHEAILKTQDSVSSCASCHTHHATVP